MNFKFDVEAVRKDFPACERKQNGVPFAYLDGPGGSQVPKVVADAIADYLFYHNANEHGFFDTSRESDKMYEDAREVCADFLGCKPGELAFGYASTQNNFNLAFALTKQLKAGDEIIVTDIDHRCNRSPWLALSDFGCVVKSIRVDPDKQQIDLDDLKAKLSPKTKLAAFNWASNATGTVSDVKTMCKMAHEVGAITVVDAVHYAAHFPIDVKDIDTDVLVCSAYKFYGPHMGLIYIRESLLDTLDYYNVKTDDLTGIRKTHMGTPPFEMCCGVAAAVDWIASVGQKYAPCFENELKGMTGRRRNVFAGMQAFSLYQEPLAEKLRMALRQIPNIRVYGPAEGQPRTATIVFTIENKHPADICKALGDLGISTWDGDFYAVEIVNDVLGLRDKGGLVRIGLAAYNTEQDINRTIEAIRAIAGK